MALFSAVHSSRIYQSKEASVIESLGDMGNDAQNREGSQRTKCQPVGYCNKSSFKRKAFFL